MDDTTNQNTLNTDTANPPVGPTPPVVSTVPVEPPHTTTTPPPASTTDSFTAAASPPPAPKSNKSIFMIIIVAFLALSIPIAVYVSQQAQDIRQRAAEITATITVDAADQTACIAACKAANIEDHEVCDTDARVFVNRWYCDGLVFNGGCQDELELLCDSDCNGQWGFNQNITCGTQQVDSGCATPSNTYQVGGKNFIDSIAYVGTQSCDDTPPPSNEPEPSPSPSLSPSPTPAPSFTPSVQCVKTQAYTVTGAVTSAASWDVLTPAELSSQPAGATVYFTCYGTGYYGANIDKSRIRVNSTTWTAQDETTSLKPKNIPTEPNEYYTVYTIPSGVTGFTVEAQVHNATNDTWN